MDSTGDAKSRRRGGRPRTREKPALPASYVGFRASHELKERLEKAATASGRSLSTEAQYRLEQALWTERVMGSASWRFGYYLMTKVEQGEWRAPSFWLEMIREGELAAAAEAKRQGIEAENWIENQGLYEAAWYAITRRMIELMPGWNGEYLNGSFQALLLNEQRRRFGPEDAQAGLVEQPAPKKDDAA